MAYALCYAALCVFGLVASVSLVMQRGSPSPNKTGLLIPALGPLLLLFVELTSLARVLCLFVVAVAAIGAAIGPRTRLGNVG